MYVCVCVCVYESFQKDNKDAIVILYNIKLSQRMLSNLKFKKRDVLLIKLCLFLIIYFIKLLKRFD